MMEWLFKWPYQDLVALETELLQRGRTSILKLMTHEAALTSFENFVHIVVGSPPETATQVLELWRAHLGFLHLQAKSPIKELLLFLGIGPNSCNERTGLIRVVMLAQRFPFLAVPLQQQRSGFSFGTLM